MLMFVLIPTHGIILAYRGVIKQDHPLRTSAKSLPLVHFYSHGTRFAVMFVMA